MFARSLLPVLLLAWMVASLAIGQTAPTPPADVAAGTNTAPVAPSPPPQVTPAELVAEAESALTRLQGIAAEPGPETAELAMTERLSAYTPQAENFARETHALLAAGPTLDQLRSAEKTWKFLAASPAQWKQELTRRATELSVTLTGLDQEKAKWEQAQKTMAGPGIPPELRQRIADILKLTIATRQTVVKRQAKVLALQDQVIRQDSEATAMLTAIAQARDRAVNQLFVQNAPPIWNLGDPAYPAPSAEARPTWAGEGVALVDYFQQQKGRLLVHGAVLFLLLVFFRWMRDQSRRWEKEGPADRAADNLFETPVCNAVLLALVGGVSLYPLPPHIFVAFCSALALVPAVVILRRLLDPRLFPILNALVVLFFVQELRSIAALSPGAVRLFFLLEMSGGVLFVLWLLTSNRLSGVSGENHRFSAVLRFAATCALGFLFLGLLAHVLGFVLLGNLLCEAVQRSANLALILYAGLQIVNALLSFILRLRPVARLNLVRTATPQILRRTYRVLGVLAGVLWTLFALERFSLRQPVLNALVTFFLRPLPDGTYRLGLPGKLLAAGLSLWLALLLSRFVRYVVEGDVYPRFRLAAGLPYAISTTLHYAALVVAFLAATAVLGIDMTKFTILVSALGVGVGFGLQNVINNFVSGLILLFERPVKIGDSIQVGDAIGVVEKIGIRASILRTTTGAELIVPNGSLISDRVTNFTFSNDARILSVPLTIARGPDIAHVMELLLRTARAHPRVVARPEPQVLIASLGATVVFELRAWTSEVEEWNTVRSELMLALNNALAAEGIIPA